MKAFTVFQFWTIFIKFNLRWRQYNSSIVHQFLLKSDSNNGLKTVRSFLRTEVMMGIRVWGILVVSSLCLSSPILPTQGQLTPDNFHVTRTIANSKFWLMRQNCYAMYMFPSLLFVCSSCLQFLLIFLCPFLYVLDLLYAYLFLLASFLLTVFGNESNCRVFLFDTYFYVSADTML
jgi:hypothetical protein